MSNDIRFDGRVAVITGAAGSLGTTYCVDLAARGAAVIVNDIGAASDGTGSSSSAAQELADKINAKGGRAIANQDDIATRDGAARVIQAAFDNFGSIDILINNAGIMRDKVFKKMSLDDFEAVLQLNLLGATYTCHSAFPHMIKQNYGRILMTTSASGLYGVFGAANYAAAKMALLGLTNTLSLEGQRHNINVNSLAPVAASRLLQGFVDNARMMNKFNPEAVTPMAVYLCSEHCDVSGETLVAGGGYFSRVVVHEGQGFVVDQNQPLTAETVAENYHRIAGTSEVNTFPDSLAAVQHIVKQIS